MIRDERVRQMIRVRAYEIYQMRGQQPGGQAEDWLQAENEVLAFLMADQPQHPDAPADQPSPALTEQAAATAPKKTPKKTRPRTHSTKKPPAKRGTSKESAEPKRKPARKPSSPKKPK